MLICDIVPIKCGVYLWDGIRLGSNVFIGPNTTFINDNYPHSKEYPDEFLHIIVEDVAYIEAGVTILGELRIGKNLMIGAGSVLTKSVPNNEPWVGNPARFVRKIAENLLK